MAASDLRGANGHARTLRLLSERAASYFADLSNVAEVRLLDKRRRAYSEILRIAVSDSQGRSRNLVVKLFPQAEAQFRTMKQLWARFEAHPTWRIPRPLDYLSEESALVMEEVPGLSLMKKLPRLVWFGDRANQAVQDCRRAGGWLRFYHDLARAERSVPLNAANTWPGLDSTIDELAKLGFEKSLCRIMHTGFVPRVKQIVCEARPVSNVHGDFTADNLMINNDSVVVLDLTANFRSAIDFDIASFLNSILMLRLSRPVPSAALERMRNAFLEGYFDTEEPALTVIYFLQGIGLADVALEIVQRRRSLAVRKWVECTVGGAIKKIIVELGKLS